MVFSDHNQEDRLIICGQLGKHVPPDMLRVDSRSLCSRITTKMQEANEISESLLLFRNQLQNKRVQFISWLLATKPVFCGLQALAPEPEHFSQCISKQYSQNRDILITDLVDMCTVIGVGCELMSCAPHLGAKDGAELGRVKLVPRFSATATEDDVQAAMGQLDRLEDAVTRMAPCEHDCNSLISTLESKLQDDKAVLPLLVLLAHARLQVLQRELAANEALRPPLEKTDSYHPMPHEPEISKLLSWLHVSRSSSKKMPSKSETLIGFSGIQDARGREEQLKRHLKARGIDTLFSTRTFHGNKKFKLQISFQLSPVTCWSILETLAGIVNAASCRLSTEVDVMATKLNSFLVQMGLVAKEIRPFSSSSSSSSFSPSPPPTCSGAGLHTSISSSGGPAAAGHSTAIALITSHTPISAESAKRPIQPDPNRGWPEQQWQQHEVSPAAVWNYQDDCGPPRKNRRKNRAAPAPSEAATGLCIIGRPQGERFDQPYTPAPRNASHCQSVQQPSAAHSHSKEYTDQQLPQPRPQFQCQPQPHMQYYDAQYHSFPHYSTGFPPGFYPSAGFLYAGLAPPPQSLGFPYYGSEAPYQQQQQQQPHRTTATPFCYPTSFYPDSHVYYDQPQPFGYPYDGRNVYAHHPWPPPPWTYGPEPYRCAGACCSYPPGPHPARR